MASSRFTKDQIAGVVAAQIEGGATAAAAAASAAAGRLPGLAPFVISESSARSHAGRARRHAGVEVAGGAELADVSDRAAQRLARVVAARVAELEAAAEPDPEQIVKWARAARELDRLARAVSRPRPSRTAAPPPAPEQDDPEDDFFARLASNGSG